MHVHQDPNPVDRRRRCLRGRLAATSASAAPVTGDVPTFQEFADRTYQDGQVYVVNGDEPEGSIGGLRQFYDAMVSTPKHVDEDVAHRQHASAAGTTSGRRRRSRNLTYCVSTKFGADYSRVVVGHGGRRRPVGGRVVARSTTPTSRARTATATRATARSSSPSSRPRRRSTSPAPSSRARSKRSRNVLVDATSIWNSGSWTPSNIMAPRARPHPRLPPRAHPPRGRHLLRGQQLASADALRLVVDHALPAVQRDVRATCR